MQKDLNQILHAKAATKQNINVLVYIRKMQIINILLQLSSKPNDESKISCQVGIKYKKNTHAGRVVKRNFGSAKWKPNKSKIISSSEVRALQVSFKYTDSALD